jgi:hypothetical protein
LSTKEKVLPTGGAFLLLLICASLLPSRQTEADCLAAVIVGGGATTVTG